MSRSGAVTFKGKPMTLAGNAVTVGQQAPQFKAHRFADGQMTEVTPESLKGKPTIISVVPSLDTPVCQKQTKNFNQQLAAYGDKIRHYQSEKEETNATAEGFEAEYDRLEARDDQFDMAEATASVAIALLGITALTQRRRLLYLAWAFAAIGLFIGAAGFAGLSLHVGFAARALR